VQEVEIAERLSGLETALRIGFDGVHQRLDRLNGSVSAHERKLGDLKIDNALVVQRIDTVEQSMSSLEDDSQTHSSYIQEQAGMVTATKVFVGFVGFVVGAVLSGLGVYAAFQALLSGTRP
jgi:hypothetical protein